MLIWPQLPIYFSGCYVDGNPLQDYGGFAHSFVFPPSRRALERDDEKNATWRRSNASPSLNKETAPSKGWWWPTVAVRLSICSHGTDTTLLGFKNLAEAKRTPCIGTSTPSQFQIESTSPYGLKKTECCKPYASPSKNTEIDSVAATGCTGCLDFSGHHHFYIQMVWQADRARCLSLAASVHLICTAGVFWV